MQGLRHERVEIKSKRYGELGTAGTAAEFYAFQPGPGAWGHYRRMLLPARRAAEARGGRNRLRLQTEVVSTLTKWHSPAHMLCWGPPAGP